MIYMGNWRLEARCTNELSVYEAEDLFFSKGREKNKAINFCRGCPVIEDCLEFAIKTELVYYGIFGGMTPKERRAVFKFRQELNGVVITNPRKAKKVKRSGFKLA